MSTLALEESSSTRTLLDSLFREQQSLAVEEFSRWHDDQAHPATAGRYRDLIPSSAPGEGFQYAFEVDLDACSGCKSCVAACHSLNGLDDDELWRSVGLLQGGNSHAAVLQHVTTACHHCVEPACLDGCPVEAYEKDALTGIVRHLDDQCIGCQYCILKCPYDVPKYSRERGIVRKCDMCQQRLAVGEAPACVQACPNQAIRITVVGHDEVVENAEANFFLPGAPEPRYTLPTTIYKSRKPLPSNLLSADYFSAAPQHAHWPLVIMLVLTQMSVGAFLIDHLIANWTASSRENVEAHSQTVHLAAAFILGAIGLGASVFHLGRPWLAYRAVMGWRTSWLSREVIAFGMFATLAFFYAAVQAIDSVWLALDDNWRRVLGGIVAASGLAGVACSTMIYASTRRPFWNAGYTAVKFFLTCAVLGIPIAICMYLVVGISTAEAAQSAATSGTVSTLCAWMVGVAAAKLLFEAAIFGWLGARTYTPLRRTALLLSGELARITAWRFLLGLFGGIAIPSFLLINSNASTPLVMAAAVLMVGACFAGEICERFLFFAAVVAPKMPGCAAT
jgi:Fe-S-cluster-containing dehydrogenase component/DMSO reductase anchor subunit